VIAHSPAARDYPNYVQQAAGIVSVQVNCYVEDALALMRERAEESRVTVEEIAAAVVDGSIRFDD
jgi:AmiR/NasT family two-component response regulator